MTRHPPPTTTIHLHSNGTTHWATTPHAPGWTTHNPDPLDLMCQAPTTPNPSPWTIRPTDIHWTWCNTPDRPIAILHSAKPSKCPCQGGPHPGPPGTPITTGPGPAPATPPRKPPQPR